MGYVNAVADAKAKARVHEQAAVPRLARGRRRLFCGPMDASPDLSEIHNWCAGPLHNKKIWPGLLLFQMCNNCISRTFAVPPGATELYAQWV